MRRNLKPPYKIGERFGLKGFIPPVAMVEIAKDRTIGLVSAWIYAGSKAQYLQILANSCYMQGIDDASDAMIRAGWKPPEKS
jgi:hypothetical protein